MDWKLQLVVVPVSDVDRAKSFYVEQAGFDLDVDHRAGEDSAMLGGSAPAGTCVSPIVPTTSRRSWRSSVRAR